MYLLQKKVRKKEISLNEILNHFKGRCWLMFIYYLFSLGNSYYLIYVVVFQIIIFICFVSTTTV